MARKAVQLNTATGDLERTPDLVEASEVATVPTAGGIPRANGAGTIDPGWVPPLGIAQLPVAADGEVSATKVLRADDARLGNPPVGGDLAGTAASATVARLQGRAVAATAPEDGEGLVWNHAANQWEPGSVAGGAGGDAASLQGNPVATDAPAPGDTLVWDGTQWTPAAGGGGQDLAAGAVMYLFANFR